MDKDSYLRGLDIGMETAANIAQRAGYDKAAKQIRDYAASHFDKLNLWGHKQKTGVAEMTAVDLGMSVMQPGDLGYDYLT